MGEWVAVLNQVLPEEVRFEPSVNQSKREAGGYLGGKGTAHVEPPEAGTQEKQLQRSRKVAHRRAEQRGDPVAGAGRS